MSNTRGWGTRYDKFSGEWMEQQRKKGEAAGLFLPFTKRFCETCKQHKPKDKTKAVKGWKCEDCRKSTRAA